MASDTAGTELQRAVAALARDLPRLSTADACARIGRLRREAAALGFAPAAALAAGMGDAVERDRRATPVAAWLDALALAARCGAGDSATASSLFATVAVRFAA